jgi:hypothetical protein
MPSRCPRGLYYPRELELLFRLTGFTVEHRYGDDQMGPLRASRRVLVMIGRASNDPRFVSGAGRGPFSQCDGGLLYDHWIAVSRSEILVHGDDAGDRDVADHRVHLAVTVTTLPRNVTFLPASAGARLPR